MGWEFVVQDEMAINDDFEEFEQDVDMDARFAFPQNMTEHSVLGKHLVIAPEYANWLVCDDEEYAAFRFFRDGRRIRKVEELLISQYRMTADQARAVVSRLIAQILGKEFSRDAEVNERSVFAIIGLYLTAGCNLRCTTCVWSCTVAGPDECTFAHWRRLLDALREFGKKTVALTGGEPMVNADSINIMRYAREVGLEVLLLTNGTFITRENAQVVAENCSQIRVSIDGPDATTHDSVRGKGAFDKAISALRELSVFPQCHLTIAMTPTPATLPAFRTGLRQFADWIWREIRPSISFEVTGRLMEGRNIPRMSKPEKLAFRRDVCALCNAQLGRDFVQKTDAASIVPNRRVSGCGLAEMVSVLANGDVGLCAYCPGPLCNIKDIEDGGGKTFLLNLAPKLEQLIHSTRVEKLRPCGECDLKYFCGGKCRKDNQDDCGDPNVCECDDIYREEWYEELVRISPYVVEPLTEFEERK